MKKLNQESSKKHSSKTSILVAVMTIALFVISAGAPSCMIGIGK